MKKLNINLENCYGIKKLKVELDFSNHTSVAIYASNGMMKTSFANTFRDLSIGENSRDRVFSYRNTVREIKDENSSELIKENIFVVERYDGGFKSKKMSTLLADKDLKKEYTEIHEGIDEAKNNLLKKLKQLAGLNQNIEKKISESFYNKEFLDIIEIVEERILNNQAPQFQDITYNEIFNDKVLGFLNTQDVKMRIKEYIEKYDELLNKSQYLKQGFNHYNISSIQKNLKDHGFFKAHHSINLCHEADKQEITNAEDFATVIQKEKNIVLNNPELLKKWDEIHEKLSANNELRSFSDYLFDHKEILPELENMEIFAQEIWISYFIVQKELYLDLLHKYRNGEGELKKIIEKAKKQETDWKRVIDIFNRRFHLPFQITVENQEDVILKSVNPNIKFIFENSGENSQIEENSLLKVLSDGEQRALYHLNIIFEVEARKNVKQETLFIIDDISDSFDYHNKYAIIQYLKEMSDEHLFKLIILTHNFDFFRTVHSREIADYSKCFFVYKTINDEVKLEKADGLNNIFTSLTNHLEQPKKLIASIAFVRNIIEYTKGNDNEGFEKLTSLLHWKPDTEKILLSDLKEVFTASFINIDTFPTINLTEKVVDMIFAESEKCLSSDDGVNFENKIVLSVGIRLKAERYIIKKINEIDSDFVLSIKKNQTHELIKKYKEISPNETENIKIFEEVGIMTPSNIHLNSFMYEPILDMSDKHLKNLYKKLESIP